jgi:cold shock CspA family protein
MQGVVSAFDTDGGVGIIDADDGEIVLFNRDNLRSVDPAHIAVGARVRFRSHEGGLAPHADSVFLASGKGDR